MRPSCSATSDAAPAAPRRACRRAPPGARRRALLSIGARSWTAGAARSGGPVRSSTPCASAGGPRRHRAAARRRHAAPRAESPGRSRGSGSAWPRRRPRRAGRPSPRRATPRWCPSHHWEAPHPAVVVTARAVDGLRTAVLAISARGHRTPRLCTESRAVTSVRGAVRGGRRSAGFCDHREISRQAVPWARVTRCCL